MSLNYSILKIGLLCFVQIFLIHQTYSQIQPGLIVEQATGSGRIVLDPNLDGYISLTTAGFSGTDDQTSSASEIVFNKIPFISEPTSDLGAGPSCNYTDFVLDTVNINMGSAGGYYLDAKNNLIFRFRLGTYSPNTKSYSVLIDIDQKFGSSGPNADPHYVIGNPGFEIEILLSTNNGVYIYDVNNNTNTTVLKTSYTVTTNYQKSKALSQVCGNYDFFLDLFVPFADLTTYFGITTSTPLRFAALDNMSAFQPSTGNLSNISDIWGVSGSNNESGLNSFIESQTPVCASCTPVGLRTACPSINSPIGIGATSVSGTGTNGDTIKLYKLRNTTSRIPNSATYTIVSGGVWTISGLSGIVSGDTIAATATSVGKGESIKNCDLTLVQSCGVIPAVSITGMVVNTKGICYTGGGAIVGATINIYDNGTLLTPFTPSIVNGSGNFTWDCNTGNSGCSGSSGCLTANASLQLFQVSGGCTSAQLCVNVTSGGGGGAATPGTSTAAPTITTNPIINGTTPITGTCVSGASIVLFANDIQIGSVTGSTTWSISPSPTITTGQIISAKQRATGQCQSTASTTRTVSRVSTAPVVNTAGCGTTTTVNGTSSEASGTRIIIYDNGTAKDSTTVTSAGTWTKTLASGSYTGPITAKSRITGGTLSAASNSVTITTKTTNSVTISGSYTNQSTSVTGTGTNGDVIRLYIDDMVFATTATVSGGTWTIAVTAGLDLFKGAVLKATATTGSNCESTPSSTVTVTSVAPTAINVAQTVSTCNGIASISIPSTQNGVLYQLYDGASTFSNGVVGNGGTITLLSSFVSSTKTGLTVKATSIVDETSTATMTGTVTINILAADSTWRGTFSNDWFDYRNWCLNGAIPTSTIKAKILAGTPFSPVIASSGAVCDTLIIYSGATLTTSGTKNLDVYGSWINNGGTFTPNSGTVTFRGTDNLFIGGTTTTTFNNLTANITGTTGNDFITLTQPITVTGALTLTDGRINTTLTNILSLTSTATTSGGSTASFVNGPMNKTGSTAFVFPVGDGLYYGPIAIGAPTSSSTFRAQYTHSGYSNTSTMAGSPSPVLNIVSNTEYWQLDRTSGTGDATVTLNWNNTNNSSGISNCSDLRVAKWSGTEWQNNNNTSTTTGGCPSSGSITTSSAVTSFGTFTFGTIGFTPLPVKLLSFTGICEKSDVRLKWITANEINNDYFTIERGINGTDLVAIGTLAGHGNTNQMVHYEFIDKGVVNDNLPNVHYFYRLKQTDFDGKFEYSNFIKVKNCKENLSEIVLYPNISNGTINLISNDQPLSSIEIYNSIGVLVFKSNILTSKEEIFLNLNGGVYHYILKNENIMVGKGKLIIE